MVEPYVATEARDGTATISIEPSAFASWILVLLFPLHIAWAISPFFPPETYGRWFMLATACLLIPSTVRRVSVYRILWNGPAAWIWSFLLLALLSMSISGSFAVGRILWWNCLLAFLGGSVAVAAGRTLSSKRQRRIAVVLIPTVWLVAALAPLTTRAGWQDFFSRYVTFPMAYPGWTSKYTLVWLVLFLWPCVTAASHLRRRRKALITATIVAVGLSIFAGNSVAAIGAYLVALLVFLAALLAPTATRICVAGVFGISFFLAPLALKAAIRDPSETARLFPSVPTSIQHRLFIWDFAIDRILHRPLQGWGFGKAYNSPGDQIPIALAYPTAPNFLQWTMVDAGEHPHSLALTLWLELGMAGPLILAGTLWAILWGIEQRNLRPIQSAAATAAVAAPLVVLTTTFPVWFAEIQLLLWMLATAVSAVLVSAGHSDPTARKAQQSRWRAAPQKIVAVGALLAFGGGALVLLVDTASRRLARDLKPTGGIEIGDGGRQLLVGGRAVPVIPVDIGLVDRIVITRGAVRIEGWAVDPQTGRAASDVYVFAAGRLLAGVRPDVMRPEVRGHFNKGSALFSGFQLEIRGTWSNLGPEEFRVFALSEDGWYAELGRSE